MEVYLSYQNLFIVCDKRRRGKCIVARGAYSRLVHLRKIIFSHMVYFEKMDNSLGPNPQAKLLLDKLT